MDAARLGSAVRCVVQLPQYEKIEVPLSSVPMSLNHPSLDHSFQTLRKVRALLLQLHKALLESEKTQYEQRFGKIQSKGQFLQLVMGDPWFNWLRDYSQFIVQIDESFSPKEPFTLEQAELLLAEVEHLLIASEHGTERQQKYHAALEREDDIAQMHTELLSLLRLKP